MLEKLFSKRQKKEPAPEKTDSRFRMVSEEDMQQYEFQDKLFKTIVSVEADAPDCPHGQARRVLIAKCSL